MLRKLVCILVIGLLAIGLFNVVTQARDTMPHAINKSSEPNLLFTSPHLISQKTANPTNIYINGSGMIPEASTVTLRVTAIGDTPTDRQPLDVLLLIDTTGSMSSAVNLPTDNTIKITAVKNACNNFLTQLNFNSTNLTQSDRVAVMNFSAPTVTLVQGFTNSPSAISSALATLTPNGGTNLLDATEYAVNQVDHDYFSNHIPIVIAINDGPSDSDVNYTGSNGMIKLCTWLSAQHNNTGVLVYTIGLGQDVQPSLLQPIAAATGGEYYYAPDSATLNQIYVIIANSLIKNIAATAPSPTESMITDVIPPYIRYQGSWSPTSNDSVTIMSFSEVQESKGSYLWDLCWDVPLMKIGDVFEVQYNIKSTQLGWQSVGVNRINATTLYNNSNWCKVKYKDYQYYKTNNLSDIWTNDTNDASIFVSNSVVPELSIISILPPFSMIALFVTVIKRRKVQPLTRRNT